MSLRYKGAWYLVPGATPVTQGAGKHEVPRGKYWGLSSVETRDDFLQLSAEGKLVDKGVCERRGRLLSCQGKRHPPGC